MSRLSGLGQPRGLGPPGLPPTGRRARPGRSRGLGPAGRPPTGQGGMKTGTGISLITVGAILLFALSAGTPRWLNLQIVGVILILAGTLGMLLPWLAGTPRDRFRRWVVSLPARSDNERPTSADQAVHDDRQRLVRDSGVNGDSPTLADDLLNLQHDPPL